MEKLVNYRRIVQQVLSDYATPAVAPPNQAKYEVLFDEKRDHYMVIVVGWEKEERVYLPVLHLDIIDGKIWLQECATDYNIIEDLLLKGVPKSDIVLGIHPESVREQTGYAVC